MISGSSSSLATGVTLIILLRNELSAGTSSTGGSADTTGTSGIRTASNSGLSVSSFCMPGAGLTILLRNPLSTGTGTTLPSSTVPTIP